MSLGEIRGINQDGVTASGALPGDTVICVGNRDGGQTVGVGAIPARFSVGVEYKVFAGPNGRPQIKSHVRQSGDQRREVASWMFGGYGYYFDKLNG